MKRIFLALTLWALSAPLSSAFAQGWVSLGGALDEGHCCRMAGAAGYNVCRFGGYVGGIYYWNACLASEPRGGGGNNGGNGYPNGQFTYRFEETAYWVQQAAFNVDWYIVSHNGDRGAVVYHAMKAHYEALKTKLDSIHEQAQHGRDAYDLRREITEAKVLYGKLRTAYQSIEYLVQPTGKPYWRALEQQMRTF